MTTATPSAPASDSPPARRWPEALVFALRAAVSVALIAWAVRKIDWAEAATRLADASPAPLLAAFAMILATVALTAERWHVLLARLGHELPRLTTLRFVAIGHFFNQGLPSTLGGDAMRVWLARGAGVPTGDAVRSVLLERLTGLAVMLLLALGGLPALAARLGFEARTWGAIAIVGGGLGGLALALLALRAGGRLARHRIGAQLVRLATDARAALGHGPTLAALLALSLASQLLLCLSVWALARGFATPLGALDAVLVMPIVFILLVIPISIAGWGLRESLMVVGLGVVGVPATEAVLVSMGFGLANLAGGLIGGVWWLASDDARPPPARTAGG